MDAFFASSVSSFIALTEMMATVTANMTAKKLEREIYIYEIVLVVETSGYGRGLIPCCYDQDDIYYAKLGSFDHCIIFLLGRCFD